VTEPGKTPRRKEAGTPRPVETEAEAVARYLRENPDFFVRNEALLRRMTPPRRWTGDGVVDIQKYMLDSLRGEMESLRTDAREVIETTRSNMSSQARTHAAVLALIRAADFDELTRIIGYDLPLLLDVDVATVGFEPGNGVPAVPTVSHVRRLRAGAIEAVFGNGNGVVLLDSVDDDGTVFGAAAGLVRSAALARLGSGKVTPPGILALGSRGDAFHPGQGTELVGFLARVVEACILRCLEAPG